MTDFISFLQYHQLGILFCVIVGAGTAWIYGDRSWHPVMGSKRIRSSIVCKRT